MRVVPRSLVRRLVLVFLLPSLVVLGAGALVVYSRTARALRESVAERLNAIAALKESALDTWVDRLYSDVVFTSHLIPLVDAAADLAAESTPPARRQAAQEELSTMLRLLRNSKPSLAEVFALAPTGGRVVASTDESRLGQFRVQDRYYVEGRQGPFVQNVYPSPVTLRPALTISTPIKEESGTVVGVLAAHLSLDYLDQQVLRRTGLGRTGTVTLVDKHRVLVTGRRYGAEQLGAAPASMAVDEVVKGRSGGGLYRGPDGAEVIGVYRWLEERELGLIVEIQQQEAFEPARRLALFTLLAGSLGLVLLLAAIYLAARHIAAPILEITDAAAGVRDGDLDVRAPVPTDDEVGTLALTFNHMVEQLADEAERRRLTNEEREALIAELERKNAELERFSYTVSHDLKNPLLTIRGFSGLLRQDIERGDLERAGADVERILDASEKMVQLLGDLLDLARVGRVISAPEEVCFARLAREVTESVAESGEERVEFDVAADLPIVFGDPIRLREVLENLVSNACKFMGAQPRPRVQIGSRREGDQPVLFVRDNGVGIAHEYHENIFGLFNRLDPSAEGTGVGLAIVRRIIEYHKGRIWVESEGRGLGSTFCFTLSAGDGMTDVTESG